MTLESLGIEIIGKLRQIHFLIFPMLLMNYFGIGFLFILAYYGFDYNLLKTIGIVEIIIAAIVLSCFLSFLFLLISLLLLSFSESSTIRSQPLRKYMHERAEVFFITNTYCFSVVYLLALSGFYSNFTNDFLILTIILLTLSFILAMIGKLSYEKKQNKRLNKKVLI